jgi:hypothetical protein
VPGKNLTELWQLIDAAKGATDPKQRRLLIDEAYELMRRARQMRHGNAEEKLSPQQESYRLWLSSNTGKTLWIDLKTESRADALWAADGLAAVCADEYDEFELWQGSTVLLNAETKVSCFSLKTGFEVSLTSQQSVLETEDALLRSHTALARSRKLLDASAELRDAVTARRPDV